MGYLPGDRMGLADPKNIPFSLRSTEFLGVGLSMSSDGDRKTSSHPGHRQSVVPSNPPPTAELSTISYPLSPRATAIRLDMVQRTHHGPSRRRPAQPVPPPPPPPPSSEPGSPSASFSQLQRNIAAGAINKAGAHPFEKQCPWRHHQKKPPGRKPKPGRSSPNQPTNPPITYIKRRSRP